MLCIFLSRSPLGLGLVGRICQVLPNHAPPKGRALFDYNGLSQVDFKPPTNLKFA